MQRKLTTTSLLLAAGLALPVMGQDAMVIEPIPTHPTFAIADAAESAHDICDQLEALHTAAVTDQTAKIAADLAMNNAVATYAEDTGPKTAAAKAANETFTASFGAYEQKRAECETALNVLDEAMVTMDDALAADVAINIDNIGGLTGRVETLEQIEPFNPGRLVARIEELEARSFAQEDMIDTMGPVLLVLCQRHTRKEYVDSCTAFRAAWDAYVTN